jgi:hypothetical protein
MWYRRILHRCRNEVIRCNLSGGGNLENSIADRLAAYAEDLSSNVFVSFDYNTKR